MTAPSYNGSTFNESFSQARNDLGPGQTFIHNNKEFTTDRADDINISNNSGASLTHDTFSADLGMTHNADPVISDTKNDTLTGTNTTTTAPVESILSTQETPLLAPTYTASSFNESFAKARDDLGPGKTFIYDNKVFTTDRDDDKKNTVINSIDMKLNAPDDKKNTVINSIDMKLNAPDDTKNEPIPLPSTNVASESKSKSTADVNTSQPNSAIDMNKTNNLSLSPNGISNAGLELLKIHEGDKKTAYNDTKNNLTVGYGHKVLDVDNIKKGDIIDNERSNKFLNDDVNTAVQGCQRIFGSKWNELDQPRKDILVNMAFQMGETGLTGFKNMISAIKEKDYNKAADEMLDSQWHKSDSPDRAKELSEKMRNGL